MSIFNAITILAYYQGTEDPKTYKKEKAIVVQPRFEEPLYRNYDLYEDKTKKGPGGGLYQNMNQYDNTEDFISQKNELKNRYVAEDSYIKEEQEKIKPSPTVKAMNDLANQYLVKIAKDKKKKLDPKAKVRNRGSVCCSAESPNVTDHKDHFPINDADQARNALARVHQYKGKKPSWWKGSLESLVNTVSRKVHSKYPKIKISD